VWRRRGSRGPQQIAGLGLQPSRRGGRLTFGAMAIAPGVTGDLLIPALRTLQDVRTQGRRAAPCQIIESSPLGSQGLSMRLVKFVGSAPADLGHFELRPGHGLDSSPGGSFRSSSGWRVDWRAAVAMCT
jgi:hypothetical protein